MLRRLIAGDGLTMNDGGVDPQGRFWVGEMDLAALVRIMEGGDIEKEKKHKKGRLWRFNGKDGKCDVMDKGLMCMNGVGWSPDGKTSRFPCHQVFLLKNLTALEVYVGDSGTQTVYKYDFNGETGKISNREVLFEGLGKGVLNDGFVVE